MNPNDSVIMSLPPTENVTSTPSSGAPTAVNASIILFVESYEGSANPVLIG